MPTDKQIAASRANGARSRGPKSPHAKSPSAGNSARQGLLARAILLEGESRHRFDDLVNVLNASLQPRTAIDELLIGKMAAAHWRQMRLWNLERQGDKTLSGDEMRLDRQFFRTFDRYVRLRNFSGETNPITPAFPTPGAIHEPRTEPRKTQPEPGTP